MTKKTFLFEKQKALGAKIIDFAGWMMPVQFTSIIEEHNNVRNNVGLFDVSHMGEFFVTGKDAAKFLNKLVPQNILNLKDSKAVYCQLTNENAGLVDDLIIYKLEDEHYLLIVNASRADEDLNWITRNKIGFDVEIDNQTHNYSLLAIQGPKAKDVLFEMGFKDLPEFFSIKKDNIFNTEIYVSRTGYTGEDGAELLIRNDYAERLWDKVMEAGQKYNLLPIGLGARDTLRLEAALHLYGNDLDETTTPIEAGLKWSVCKDKKEDYNGKDVIMSQLENAPARKLIGMKLLTKAIARHNTEIYYNDENIGIVTSGGFSPTLNANIALGYVKSDKNISVGDTVQVKIREKLYDAEVVKRPFVKKNYSN